ncbi:hypothetical protein SNE40_012757 [Patella caerulea]|uniref:Sulfatase N-terminal domain-containing protein n=1 Tax=Patella caerulea TaxID=87958 RepID=A0AAN8PFS6_PATCE
MDGNSIVGFYILLSIALYVQGAKKNVLFLVADDFRPNIGVYQGLNLGPNHTPNLDTLASQSMVMKQAYVQYAVCGPSRSSFLTGRRPDTTHVYDLETYFRNVGGNFTTIPQYFKNHGYTSVGIGKIFHPGLSSNYDDPISWSKNYHVSQAHHYGHSRHSHSWRAVPDIERQQFPLVDEMISTQAKKSLNELATAGQPFFLAVGFHKPHLPFLFPQKFLSDIPVSMVDLPTNAYAPVDMPDKAWNNYAELRVFNDIAVFNATGNPNTTLPDNVVKDLRRAYFSAVSYMDSLVGEVLSELKNLNLMNDTIISFVGDHGYSLGEHGLWTKHTTFEDAVHAPMMLRVPGLTDHGVVTNQLVEFVDLFPTLVDAARLPKLKICPEESTHVSVCTEGKSMLPLMTSPNGPWKMAAFSQNKRGKGIMGYTVRTDQYRYTEWTRFNGAPVFKPNYSRSLVGVELYDHVKDPQENVNLAHHHDKTDAVASLKKILHSGWRSKDTNPGIIG